jgi:biopolymer transport protein TolQ
MGEEGKEYTVNEVMAVSSGDLAVQFNGDLLSMILSAGIMVQFVLGLLICFSIASWAIILSKYFFLKKVEKENDLFLDVYMKAGKLSEIFPESKKFQNSTLAEVFRAGYTELGKLGKRKVSSGSAEDPGSANIEIKGIDNIERALNRACTTETTKVESAIGFLATTGSSCPFIGLFGTVWGIMTAFRGIGARGSAALAVVAPGISEALVATAAGLAAAIPAVIFYNYFQNRIKRISSEMDSFSSEFLNIIERYYMRSI